MASTSKPKPKSNRGGKNKFIPKPKQRWQVKQPTRNWLELPSDLMVNILGRIGVCDILENAQKVCTVWREICKDPAMWRVIHMDTVSCPSRMAVNKKMCRNVVDRSQGQLVELSMDGFCDDELLQFVADRASQLKRLEIVYYFGTPNVICSEALKKLSLLDELSLVRVNISKEHIEAVGRYCPLLKTLKVIQSGPSSSISSLKDVDDDDDEEEEDESMSVMNEIALAIGKNLPGLTHLELIGSCMQNIGLQAILDGCCHLESLDLRWCFCVDLNGDLGKRCSQQIKHLKLPHESLEGCPLAYQPFCGLDDFEDEFPEYFDSEEDYLAYVGYDDGFSYYDYEGFSVDMDGFPIFEDLNDWMAYKDRYC